MSSTLNEALTEIERVVRQAPDAGHIEAVVRDAYPFTRGISREDSEHVLLRLAPLFDGLEPRAGIPLGYLAGAVIEDGVSAAAVEAPILRLYERLAWAAAHEQEALDTLMEAPQPLMAVLCASPSARKAAGPIATVLRELVKRGVELPSLFALTRVLEDEKILVLEPATGLGMRARISGVADNGQLCTLLMGAFPAREGAAPRVTQSALENARGEGPTSLHERVEAAFAMYDPHAGPAPEGERFLLSNESLPAEISKVDGERMILLAPPPVPRAWRAQRAYDMRATLSVDSVLSPEEVKERLVRIQRGSSRA